MKKLEMRQVENLQGGSWAAYHASCGVAVVFLQASFLAGPIAFGATASYLAFCAILVPATYK